MYWGTVLTEDREIKTDSYAEITADLMTHINTYYECVCVFSSL